MKFHNSSTKSAIFVYMQSKIIYVASYKFNFHEVLKPILRLKGK